MSSDARKIWDAAVISHEVIRGYCQAIGDNNQPPWEQLPVGVQVRRMEICQLLLDAEEDSPERYHEAWVEMMRLEGYVYGPERDEIKKTHPRMVRWEDVPQEERLKEHLVQAVIRAVSNL